ncbi:MaoC family dehydratase N-terminal domain-containing protein [Advenella sp. EE-W14]|uniref:FAS1-like dehydratase domain-containing protein n=1 Tax=Advenella sp. EE-W14 TaxID=2722705 RepID=UPI001B7D69F6|nr:MaoC family dehydratase N-terminal domain-containing protein [Advenella sp. EE-W14]
MSNEQNGVNLNDWLGRQESYGEFINPAHVKKIALSLNAPVPENGQPLPHLWQWALFVDPLPLDELGTDGHPQRGGFLPPADNRNRMWAGGRVQFIKPLVVGQDATRTSTITAIKEKSGSTGKLLFVTVKHDYTQNNELCISEEQDIVYREPSPPKLSGTPEAEAAQWSSEIVPTSTMLFRYSAVTFNGHRIHYDYPYVTEVEGYPGLVVHGPLIATCVLRAFTDANPDKTVTGFSYRGARPLISPLPFRVEGTIKEEGKAAVWAQQDGSVAQLGEVLFK